jgi:mono/diheme cytochrome c family protein
MTAMKIFGAAGVLAAGVALAVVWGGADEAAVPGPGQGAATGAAMVAVRLPELSATARLGQQAFAENCAGCHGAGAAGQQGVAPPLIHRIYEPGHHGDMAIVLAAQRGVRAHHWRFGDMPPVPGLTERELGAIVVYIRELQRANGID